MVDLQPAIWATENLHKLHFTLFDKKKDEHWLNIIKGLSKRQDLIRKLIISLIMSWLKEIELLEE